MRTSITLRPLVVLLLAIGLLGSFAFTTAKDDEKAKPADFIFTYCPSYSADFGVPVFVISDEKLFKESGAISDTAPPAEITLTLNSLGFYETMESVYEFHGGTAEQGAEILKQAGFKEKQGFISC